MTTQHLTLIGFMGTGKTTIGKMLHEKTAYPWVDMDTELELKWGMTVSTFFHKFGEEIFREEESLLLRNLLEHHSPLIISTGGGSVLKEVNRKTMTDYSKIVCLTASSNEIVRRIGHDTTRPLLKGNVSEKVSYLLKQRESLYQFADLTINSEKHTYIDIIDKINSFWNSQ